MQPRTSHVMMENTLCKKATYHCVGIRRMDNSVGPVYHRGRPKGKYNWEKYFTTNRYNFVQDKPAHDSILKTHEKEERSDRKIKTWAKENFQKLFVRIGKSKITSCGLNFYKILLQSSRMIEESPFIYKKEWKRI